MNTNTLAKLRDNWEFLLSQGEKITYRAGQDLFYEGHQPYGLFVILTGQVLLKKHGKQCVEHFWEAPRGKVPELDAWMSHSPLCCQGIAVSDCEVIFLPNSLLNQFVKDGPKTIH